MPKMSAKKADEHLLNRAFLDSLRGLAMFAQMTNRPQSHIDHLYEIIRDLEPEREPEEPSFAE
jgi:hypothetical protein